MENQFLGNQNFNISHQTSLQLVRPNIALIKYWGKYNQIPANPEYFLYFESLQHPKLQWSF